tara:strand:- start:242 stop:1222 length:981 start_codon:yes stop_codon:yes gene_type:complete
VFLGVSTVSANSFYHHFSKSQKIHHDQLQIDVDAKISSFYSIDLIISSTPSIKFYADLLQNEGLPIDLAVIPLMESGNNPQAKSPKNALGLWQFIPSTAREWGLKSSKSFDDRKNVIKSTKTAIKYLNYLHRQLGDWNLALAAYNWGIGNVKKALKKGLVKKRRLNLKLLPRETRNYIIAFHHLNRLIKFNHKNEYLNKFPNKPYFEIIQPQNLEKFLQANKLQRLDSKVLAHINGFDVMDKSFSLTEILVPTKIFADYFSIESISFKKTTTKRKVNGCSQQYYRTRYKDSLISISRKYNIKMDKLKEMNNGVRFVRPGMQIRLCN